MDVRAQISMVFHLDKCLGCPSCTVACQTVWTDRKGAEYMAWNRVETKPGAGYPYAWEDQDHYQGGFRRSGDGLALRSTNRAKSALTVLHDPNLPWIDDYAEPHTHRYADLVTARESADQPSVRAESRVTGRPIDRTAGPGWDADLAGSAEHAAQDPNLAAASEEERARLFEVQRLVQFYLPRMCNHCVNPSCVAACPSGATYKRGEDGIVLINQERCRGWRFCVTACPYKEAYFNWGTGKSEKCNLCFPALESGQAPACFQACGGRVRFLGMVLYDADRIPEAVGVDDEQLVSKLRSIILDPHDPEVIAAARRNGVHPDILLAAQRSPVYKFVVEWGLALPLHAEYRTLPMLFYIPPMLPLMARVGENGYDVSLGDDIEAGADLLAGVDRYRLPLAYMASLFGAGNEAVVRYALRKQLAVRLLRRAVTTGDVPVDRARAALAEADCDREQADAIYRLTALSTEADRFAIPAMHREEALEMLADDPLSARGYSGIGFRQRPERGV